MSLNIKRNNNKDKTRSAHTFVTKEIGDYIKKVKHHSQYVLICWVEYDQNVEQEIYHPTTNESKPR